MRIAIIGATGMLGQHAALAALAAGHDLRLTYRKEAALARLGDIPYERAPADLGDRAALTRALQGVDGVINTAAYYPTVPRPWREEVATARASWRTSTPPPRPPRSAASSTWAAPSPCPGAPTAGPPTAASATPANRRTAIPTCR